MKTIIHLALVIGCIFTALITNAGAADQIHYYHTDPAGTPLAMTDASGNVVWKADYKPFGEEHTVTGTGANDRRFVGKEKDEETGLSYFVARYMDTQSGRFAAVDPIRAVDPESGKSNEELLLNPQRLNVYAYGLNNPYKYVDPDGNAPLITPDARDCYAYGPGGFGGSLSSRGFGRVPSGGGGGVAGNRLSAGGTVEGGGVGAVRPYYPANNGFFGKTATKTLYPGEMVDRYGGSSASRFFSPPGTPAEARALPPGTTNQPLRTFEVIKPFPVEAGTVAPAYGQFGLGTQYRAPTSLDVLLNRGFLREIGK